MSISRKRDLALMRVVNGTEESSEPVSLFLFCFGLYRRIDYGERVTEQENPPAAQCSEEANHPGSDPELWNCEGPKTELSLKRSDQKHSTLKKTQSFPTRLCVELWDICVIYLFRTTINPETIKCSLP